MNIQDFLQNLLPGKEILVSHKIKSNHVVVDVLLFSPFVQMTKKIDSTSSHNFEYDLNEFGSEIDRELRYIEAKALIRKGQLAVERIERQRAGV